MLSGVDESSHVFDESGGNVEGGVETGDDRKVERGFLSSELACALRIGVHDGDGADHDAHTVVSDSRSHHRHEVGVRCAADLQLSRHLAGVGGEANAPRSDQQRHVGPEGLVPKSSAWG